MGVLAENISFLKHTFLREKTMKKINKTPLAAAMSTAVVSAFTATPVAAETNPFAMTELSEGYMQVADGNYSVVPWGGATGKKADEASCGEGKCGEGKCGENDKKAKEGKCGEGKCGDMMDGDKMKKGMESSCGAMMKGKEGACGDMDKKSEKGGEMSCGEKMKKMKSKMKDGEMSCGAMMDDK